MSDFTKRIYLSSPHMGGDELDYIHDAFEKNWISPVGPSLDGFEEDLASYTGRKHAAALISGTAAIHLALILCGVTSGDEVICPSFTFAASANPILYQGATPVFIDSELETWNMDPMLLEEAIVDRLTVAKGDKNSKPKAIIAVHAYGMPAKIDQILAIGKKYAIPVIEDSAEALGSSINGRKCGAFGTLSVLSFNGNKMITTGGGGALLGDDRVLINKARFLATQARDDAPHYQHSELGYNYRLSNILASIGRGQMKSLDKHVNFRRDIHQAYFDNLGQTWLSGSKRCAPKMKGSKSPTGIYFLKELDGFLSNRWLSTVIVNSEETGGITNEDIRLALEEDNIVCRPVWKPLHMQPLYEGVPYYGNGVCERLFKVGLCLPSGSNMTEGDLERVMSSLKKVLLSRH